MHSNASPADSFKCPSLTVTLRQRITHVASVIETACVDSAELFKGQKAVEINHNGAVYRLQATKLGKLILTK